MTDASNPYSLRSLVLPMGEGTVVVLSFLLAIWVRFGNEFYIVISRQETASKIIVVAGISLVCSYFYDLHATTESIHCDGAYVRTFSAAGVVALLLAGITYLFPALLVGHSVFPLGVVILTVGLLSWRKIYHWLLRQPLFRERVYVLGNDDQTHRVVDSLLGLSHLGVDVVHWEGVENRELGRQALAARLQGLRGKTVHRVIVAVDDRRGTVPLQELLDLRFKGVKVEQASALLERQSGKIEIDGLCPSWLIFSDGFRVSRAYQLIRSIASAIMSCVLLIVVLPIVPFIIIAIKLTSPGPVLYRQARVGLDGKRFNCFKFRTMCAEAEADTGPTWAADDDPRITKVGHFLRLTRLDEIPQLWNILRGDMLFVGPRPERPEFVEWLANQIPYYQLRHVIRPGLTGWAQVRYKYGNSVEDAKEKLKYDLFYIKNISLTLDLLIVFRTLKVVLLRGSSS